MIFLRYSFRRVAAELPTTPEPCAVVRSSPKPGPRQLTERDLWQEKMPKRGGGGGRRWFLAEEDEDFEDFQGEPKESDLELGDGEDDNIVEIKPFTTKRTSSKELLEGFRREVRHGASPSTHSVGRFATSPPVSYSPTEQHTHIGPVQRHFYLSSLRDSILPDKDCKSWH